MLIWLIIAALGAWGMTEWLRHDIRVIEFFERLATYESKPVQFAVRVYRCGFCLSHWVAGFCLICVLLPWLWLIPLYFAVVRMSNVFNDVSYSTNRSPHKRNT